MTLRKKFFSNAGVDFNRVTPRTKPADNYLPARKEDIVVEAQKAKIKKFDASLMQDMIHLASGGSPLSIDEISGAVEAETEALYRNQPGGDSTTVYHTPDGDSGNSSDTDSAKDRYFRSRLDYHLGAREFVSNLDIKEVPGDSPLQKAVNLAKLLEKQHNQESDGQKGNSFNPNFSDKTRAKELAEKVNKAFKGAGSMSKEEMELFEVVEMDSIERAAELMDNYELFKMARDLKTISALTTLAQIESERDPEGDEQEDRAIEGLHEIGRMAPTHFGKPAEYLTYKVLSGDISISERVILRSRKQFLFMIGDNSGSMSSDHRYLKLGGVLLNRMEAVLTGDAELDFAFFNTRLEKTHKITSLEEAQQMMRYFKAENFSSGGTDINQCARQAYKRIQERLKSGEYGTTPELVIVTDGEDNTNLEGFEFNGVRVHCFVLGQYNANLHHLALGTGGMSIQTI